MGLFLFIVFVAACVVLLCQVIAKSKTPIDKAHSRKPQRKKASAEQLETPAVYTLARPDQPWHTRRHSAATGTPRSVRPAPESGPEELEYDGYSRRDRHHVAETKAHIKEEGHLEDPAAGRDKDWGEQGLAH